MKIKNLKINKKLSKKTLVLMTILSISLLNGCTKEQKDELTQIVGNAINKSTKPTKCKHLTIIFNNETITFKECDGYNLSTNLKDSNLEYQIFLDDKILIEGNTNFYNDANFCHDNINSLEKEKILIK